MGKVLLPQLVAVAMVGALAVAEASNRADVNGDGVVDMRDIGIVCENWLWQAPDPCEFALIPGGTFQMGDNFTEGNPDELPVHTVTIASFYMGRYEVTNQQYCDYLNSALSLGLITVTDYGVRKAGSEAGPLYCFTHSGCYSQHIDYNDGIFNVRTKSGRSMAGDPVVWVSWNGAVAYCDWRSRQEGRPSCYDLATWKCDYSKNGYRLPTEAQWEYAARGGLSDQRFPWGDTINHDYANYYAVPDAYDYDTGSYTAPTHHPTWSADGIVPYTSPTASFSANGYGLYDMAGNVREWCNDWYNSYGPDAQENPTGPSYGRHCVIRGGDWGHFVRWCRVAARFCDVPSRMDWNSGFRIVLNP